MPGVEIGDRRAGITHAPAVSCHQACKPGSVSRLTAGDGHSSRAHLAIAPHATNPGGSSESRLKRSPAPRRPYSVLLPVGFAVPSLLPRTRCALTAPFHPYPASPFGRRRAVCFLWHCPWGCPRRRLSGTVLPWSPDFPLRLDTQNMRRSGHPAC